MTEKSTSKTQIAAAIIGGIFLLVAAVISSPQWFKYFFPNQYIEQEHIPTTKTKNVLSKENEKKPKDGIENIAINRIELCPIDSKLPAYIYLEIKNKGTKELKNVTIELDLGRASFKGIDANDISITQIDTTRIGELKITYSTLKENDTRKIYCLITQPIFKSIKINGSNLTFAKEYTYKDYIDDDSSNGTNLSAFYVFLQILIACILIVFSIFFISMTYRFLKKIGVIDWD